MMSCRQEQSTFFLKIFVMFSICCEHFILKEEPLYFNCEIFFPPKSYEMKSKKPIVDMWFDGYRNSKALEITSYHFLINSLEHDS